MCYMGGEAFKKTLTRNVKALILAQNNFAFKMLCIKPIKEQNLHVYALPCIP